MRILIIEDDVNIARNLYDYLESRGHSIDAAADGSTGLHLAGTQTFDAIVLAFGQPGMDGLTLAAKLREDAHVETPILMLTARDTLEDKLEGFSKGADDYVVKPAALREIEARIRALVRRAQGPQESSVLQVGDLRFDPGSMRIERAGQAIALAPVPARILLVLMRHSPNVVHRLAISREIWGEEGQEQGESHALIVHMHSLRSAIDKPFERQLIHTVRGFGYRIALDEPSL